MSQGGLLVVRGLSVAFKTQKGTVQAIDGIDLDLNENETLAIVGESGCGKSVLGHAIMRLLDDIAVVRGSVRFREKEVYEMDTTALLNLRGGLISLVPQSPSSSFNPVITIGKQIEELIEKAGKEKGNGARKRALEYLSLAGFSEPELIHKSYPHRLSGGMCERALIAMALSVEPELVIADEPTKGLDALSRKNILGLLHKLAKDASMIMITHDLKAAETCERLAVMYSGEIVEEGPTGIVLNHPRHVYTKGLIDAQPSRGMTPIKGRHNLFSHNAEGCRFKERCDAASNECNNHPMLSKVEDYRKVRCCHA
ncbi:MAG: ABC transporter ATP-binding protein [Methanothrix sp.]|nr:MAG: ABC transporter ATP-binding protein [Methanothrix sp.]